tara:strand:+ start:176 stop:1423 length:1248 start_codon:yes stop_codon:yes gene_type:complete
MSKISCSIITIGDEILYGHILDTNSKWLSQELNKIGVKIFEKKSIGDDYNQIKDSVKNSLSNYDITILTGGLGPTNDDITKNCLNDYFKGKLIIHKKTFKHIKQIFEKRNLDFTTKNKNQALVPDTCKVLYNKFGTAPGMVFYHGDKILISLPGVPFEMKSLFEDECKKVIYDNFDLPKIYHRIIKTVGIGESWLSDLIQDWENNLPENIKLAYLPSIGRVKLRLTGFGDEKKSIENAIRKEEKKLIPIIDKYVFGYDSDELEKIIGDLLRSKNKDLSIAESCTGGYVSNLITSVPGSSKYYKGSLIAYSNIIKIKELGVSPENINDFGAVSKEVVEEMAKNIRLKFNTSIGIASSGIAGPGGGTKDKPVGTVWIAYSDEEITVSKKLNLTERRDINIILSSINLLNLLRINLKK